MATIYKDVPHLAHQQNGIQAPVAVEVSAADAATLRELAKRCAGVAEDPVNAERAELWRRLNDLEPVRPLLWLNEICWNEMERDPGFADELRFRCRSEFCRGIEIELRQTLFLWRHLQADMVVEPRIYAPKIITNSGLGITTDEETITFDPANQVVSHRFLAQVAGPDDIERIADPVITHHAEASREVREAYSSIFDGILTVEQIGSPGFWFAPWDVIIGWTGIEQGLIDLAMRPEYIHRLVDRVVGAYLAALDQYEEQGLLALNNRNVRVGSGAYGYTRALPGEPCDAVRPRCRNLWGHATPQIFSEVSPAMHEEFALAYERRWLSRFGLTYYGCCEPLHRKVGILRSIPNLRKISTSPWAKMTEMAEAVGRDYVISYKPSPACLAVDAWDLDAARAELTDRIGTARRAGCNIEVIMKDISTVHYEPRRLVEWISMASDVCRSLE